MKRFEVNKNTQGKLIKFVQKHARNLGDNGVYKMLRKGRIKVNGKCVKDDKFELQIGDVVELYINDEFFAPLKNGGLDKVSSKSLKIIYEDGNILIVDKPSGMLVHDDENENVHTLLNIAKKYLFEKGEYVLGEFAPALCHRLDRNTRGLVIIAKNAPALNEMNSIIKHRMLSKFYICRCFGKIDNMNWITKKAYLLRDLNKKQVKIFNREVKNSKEILTKFRKVDEISKADLTVDKISKVNLTTDFNCDISTLEVELLTGRTHQIRAHLAFLGLPIVGDEKYGNSKLNKQLNKKRQDLVAYKIVFNELDGIFSYLSGKTFEISNKTNLFA